MAFQRLVQSAQVRLGASGMAFTFMQSLKTRAGFILPPPTTQSRADHADQRRGMKRPFQKSDIAESFHLPPRGGISFQSSPTLRQQNERQIRPWGLRLDPARKTPDI